MTIPRAPQLVFPELPYLPRDPERYNPEIGLIGCGGISKVHLKAYKAAGYNVTALCDVKLENAENRRKDFYPEAKVFADYRELLKRESIEVVDITTHPEVRDEIIADSLRAGKHVLSQKPYVLDLDVGEQLANLADELGLLLAVNQNGRWAPHFSYLRAAVHAGLIGQVVGVHCSVHWDHSWIKGTVFEHVEHLILYDFGIHWFDFLTTVMDDATPLRLFASATKTSMQEVTPALLGQALIEYDTTQATLAFDGNVPHSGWDHTVITGSHGVIRSGGFNVNDQKIYFTNNQGTFSPTVEGTWFPDGFHGTMGELLCAIEEKRQPSHSARDNLRSLEVCFAAVESSMTNQPVVPGRVRKLPASL